MTDGLRCTGAETSTDVISTAANTSRPINQNELNILPQDVLYTSVPIMLLHRVCRYICRDNECLIGICGQTLNHILLICDSCLRQTTSNLIGKRQ